VVKLTILRDGESKTREISITRDKIDVPSLESELREDNIFVISFYSFSEKATILFRNAIIEFLDSGSTKLIIDLRGNPGGYLDSAISIASLFVEEGKPIVGEKFGDDKEAKIYRSHGPRLFNESMSLVVLVDGGSASASEILAGALKEHGIGVLVGEKTFGKGSVQELVDITPETSLKVTIANWLTPNGVSISPDGLSPDVEVVFTDEDFKKGIDTQMNKAVEILKAKK
jgi:carboxyl-terminal processing protease